MHFICLKWSFISINVLLQLHQHRTHIIKLKNKTKQQEGIHLLNKQQKYTHKCIHIHTNVPIGRIFYLIFLGINVSQTLKRFFSYQHPVPLPLVQFALESRGDELPQLWEETLHDQVRQDLQANNTNQSPHLLNYCKILYFPPFSSNSTILHGTVCLSLVCFLASA